MNATYIYFLRDLIPEDELEEDDLDEDGQEDWPLIQWAIRQLEQNEKGANSNGR